MPVPALASRTAASTRTAATLAAGPVPAGMEKLTFDLDAVRVRNAEDTKGNELLVLEVFGVDVLYASPHDLRRSDRWEGFTENFHGECRGDADRLNEYFRTIFAREMTRLVLAQFPALRQDWHDRSPTGRETRVTRPPRIAVELDEY
jgi:hypothetical protein